MNPTPHVLNPSPKTRFQALPGSVGKHKALVDSDTFQIGADFALLHVTAQWAMQVSDPQSAMAVGQKIQGAHEFLQAFKLLAETAPKPTIAATDNLTANRQ